MAHVFLIVEGQSEEQFYKQHLAAAYASQGVYVEVAMMPGKRNVSSRTQKGGSVSYETCVANVRRYLRTAAHCQLVVLVYDYYGLHPTFADDIVLPAGQPITGARRAAAIRQRLEADINDPRFYCYLQMHEFEAYLFSRPDLVAQHFKMPALQPALEHILADFANQPEAINDHPDTAPSKRLMALLSPAYYGKTTDGVAIAAAIGVAGIRVRCPSFEAFCQRLDQLR